MEKKPTDFSPQQTIHETVFMTVEFYKYQGTGNDFVMIDNRAKTFPKNTETIAKLCDRHFGIGADGLILLEDHNDTDFRMIYYNSDGNESTMCGNGGRCIVAFAHKLGLFENETTFIAVDGVHHAKIERGNMHLSGVDGVGRYIETRRISLQMIDVFSIKFEDGHAFLNTGSPHHVELVDNVNDVDVFNEGKRIRYAVYGTEGSNVNFVQKQETEFHFKIRTYERGVEDETLACGTGVTASAIAMHASGKTPQKYLHFSTKGGDLSVSFDVDVKNGFYTNVHLIGPAEFVFSGKIEI